MKLCSVVFNSVKVMSHLHHMRRNVILRRPLKVPVGDAEFNSSLANNGSHQTVN